MATEKNEAPRVFGVEMNRTGERLFANCFGCIMVRVEIAGEVVSPGTPYCYRVADDILRWAGPEDCGRGIELVLSGIADAINAAREAATENCCEHGDHPAPPGKRFCSEACKRCENTATDYGEDCAGICQAREAAKERTDG